MRRRGLMLLKQESSNANIIFNLGSLESTYFKLKSNDSYSYTYTNTSGDEITVDNATSNSAVTLQALPNSKIFIYGDITSVHTAGQPSNIEVVQLQSVPNLNDWYSGNDTSLHTIIGFEQFVNTTLAYESFLGCTNLTNIVLPDTIQEIERDVFIRCTNLNLTKLPSSLRIIDYHAFANCKNITISELPETLTLISDEAFYGCTKITRLRILNKTSKVEGGSGMFTGVSSVIIEVPAALWSAYKEDRYWTGYTINSY